MTKSTLIDAVAAAAGMKKKDAEAAVNAVFEEMAKELGEGGKISVSGFGTFTVKERAARVGRNPFTGEKMNVPASKNVAFSAFSALKNRL